MNFSQEIKSRWPKKLHTNNSNNDSESDGLESPSSTNSMNSTNRSRVSSFCSERFAEEEVLLESSTHYFCFPRGLYFSRNTSPGILKTNTADSALSGNSEKRRRVLTLPLATVRYGDGDGKVSSFVMTDASRKNTYGHYVIQWKKVVGERRKLLQSCMVDEQVCVCIYEPFVTVVLTRSVRHATFISSLYNFCKVFPWNDSKASHENTDFPSVGYLGVLHRAMLKELDLSKSGKKDLNIKNGKIMNYLDSDVKYLSFDASPPRAPLDRRGSLVHLPGSKMTGAWQKMQQNSVGAHRLPATDVDFRALVDAVPSHLLVMLWGALVAQRSVVVSYTHHGRLTSIIEAALCLLWPLEWNGVYIPLLPLDDMFLGVLNAPVPFLVGVPSTSNIPASRLQAALEDECEELVWIDLDRQEIIPPPNPPLPPDVFRFLLLNLEDCFGSESTLLSTEPPEARWRQVRWVFALGMASILRRYRKFIVNTQDYLDDVHENGDFDEYIYDNIILPFDQKSFLAQFSAEHLYLSQRFVETQIFEEFISRVASTTPEQRRSEDNLFDVLCRDHSNLVDPCSWIGEGRNGPRETNTENVDVSNRLSVKRRLSP